MFLYSASVTWFAAHLTPCIINFASQLTRCVIIFASHFGLCILITVSNRPRGGFQLGGAGSRCRSALAPTGHCLASGESPRAAGADETSLGWDHSAAGTAAETRRHLLLLFSDPNLTPLPSSAPLQPCPSSFNCFHFISRLSAFVGLSATLPCALYHTLLAQTSPSLPKRPARHPQILCSASTGGLFLQDALEKLSDLEWQVWRAVADSLYILLMENKPVSVCHMLQRSGSWPRSWNTRAFPWLFVCPSICLQSRSPLQLTLLLLSCLPYSCGLCK